MTLGSHQKSVGKSQVHLTPKWIIDALGPFSLDPCASMPRPWRTAKAHYYLPIDGLKAPWRGSIWLNPPFDRRVVGLWIARLAEHGNGVALVHARTEAAWFEPIWGGADLLCFMADRIKFCRQDGSEQPANSGAPVVLAAFGADCAARLASSGIPGAYVEKWKVAA